MRATVPCRVESAVEYGCPFMSMWMGPNQSSARQNPEARETRAERESGQRTGTGLTRATGADPGREPREAAKAEGSRRQTANDETRECADRLGSASTLKVDLAVAPGITRHFDLVFPFFVRFTACTMLLAGGGREIL